MSSQPRQHGPRAPGFGGAALALALGVAVAALSARSRQWNFDCIGYAGAARSRLGGETADVHRTVYQELARAAPPRAFDRIVNASPYRAAVAADAEVFALQLPFYTNKALYVAAVAALCAAGVSSITACFAVAAAGFAAVASVLIGCAVRLRARAAAGAAAVLLLLLPPFRELGGLATPDSLAAAFSLGGLAALVVVRSERLAMGLLLGAVLTRSDSALFAGAVLTWTLVQRGASRGAITGHWLLVMTVALAVNRLTSSYSWPLLIQHTFMTKLESASQLAHVRLSGADYLRILRRGLHQDFVLHRTTLPIFALISSVACAVSLRAARTRAYVSLHALIWVAAALHFLLFPMLADRFFAAHYASVVLLASLAVDAGRGPADREPVGAPQTERYAGNKTHT